MLTVKMFIKCPIWWVLKDKHSRERLRLLAVSHQLCNIFMTQPSHFYHLKYLNAYYEICYTAGKILM